MPLMPDENDPYEVLAEHGEVSVYRCDRGCLHLQFGNVNLRLEDEEFQELAAVVSAAARRTGGSVPKSGARYGRVQ